jgi:hypothetical protein
MIILAMSRRAITISNAIPGQAVPPIESESIVLVALQAGLSR